MIIGCSLQSRYSARHTARGINDNCKANKIFFFPTIILKILRVSSTPLYTHAAYCSHTHRHTHLYILYNTCNSSKRSRPPHCSIILDNLYLTWWSPPRYAQQQQHDQSQSLLLLQPIIIKYIILLLETVVRSTHDIRVIRENDTSLPQNYCGRLHNII